MASASLTVARGPRLAYNPKGSSTAQPLRSLLLYFSRSLYALSRRYCGRHNQTAHKRLEILVGWLRRDHQHAARCVVPAKPHTRYLNLSMIALDMLDRSECAVAGTIMPLERAKVQFDTWKSLHQQFLLKVRCLVSLDKMGRIGEYSYGTWVPKRLLSSRAPHTPNLLI